MIPYFYITSILKEIITEEFSFHTIPEVLWEIPLRKEFGDFATPIALKLASDIKTDPMIIAKKLKDRIEERLSDYIGKIEIVKPGFVNLFLSLKVLKDFLKDIYLKKQNLFSLFSHEDVLIEFVSANPTGPLSIAHGRQAIVGDVIANILKFLGVKVTKQYYINDVGRQIDLLIESVKERMKELKGEDFRLPEDGYLGEYVKDIASKAIYEKPDDLKKFTLSYILSWIKKDLEKVGVTFDEWVSQERLIQEKVVDKCIQYLKEKKLAYEKDGAIWFPSTKFGDDKDRVLIKENGEFTYFASDIALHKEKFERGFSKLINLWGPDHHGYIKRVKAAIEAMGLNQNLLEIIIVQLVTLKTKERMSKRKGKLYLLSELVDEVGKDAARFYYLTRKNSSILEFDIEKAKKASFDNPLYYIQYAHARICSIFEKANIENIDPSWVDYLNSDEDLSLARRILHFPYILYQIKTSYEPVSMIDFLKNLANDFHRFYEKERVLIEEREKKEARLFLLECTRLILGWGLNILGIEPKKRM